MTFDYIRTQTMDQVLYHRKQGNVTEEIWLRYAHLWQTAAARFGSVRYCDCAECRITFKDMRLGM